MHATKTISCMYWRNWNVGLGFGLKLAVKAELCQTRITKRLFGAVAIGSFTKLISACLWTKCEEVERWSNKHALHSRLDIHYISKSQRKALPFPWKADVRFRFWDGPSCQMRVCGLIQCTATVRDEQHSPALFWLSSSCASLSSVYRDKNCFLIGAKSSYVERLDGLNTFKKIF